MCFLLLKYLFHPLEIQCDTLRGGFVAPERCRISSRATVVFVSFHFLIENSHFNVMCRVLEPGSTPQNWCLDAADADTC